MSSSAFNTGWMMWTLLDDVVMVTVLSVLVVLVVLLVWSW